MPFKGFLLIALGPFFSGANRFSNLGRGLPKKHFCEITLKSIHLPKRRSRLKILLSNFNFGGHFVPVERNDLSNFGRESHKKHL